MEAKKKKKKVSWATDDNLAKVHYFELDESERGVCACVHACVSVVVVVVVDVVIVLIFVLTVNVNRPTSFLDAAQQEKMREREALESGLMFSRDRLIEMIPVNHTLISELLVLLLINSQDILVHWMAKTAYCFMGNLSSSKCSHVIRRKC